MNRKNFFILVFLSGVLCIISIYFLMSNLRLRQSLKSAASVEDSERRMSIEGSKIKEKLKKDLSDKRKADDISYRAMVKRLEMEEKKQAELKSKIEQLERKTNN